MPPPLGNGTWEAFAIVIGAAFFGSLGLGWTHTDAGIAYSIAMGAGIVGRLIWGWVGTKYVSPLMLLALLGFAMGVAHMALGFITPDWQTVSVWGVAFIYGLTGIGYQGVLLAEIARVSPPGMAGVITGGAVFFAYVGMILLPAEAIIVPRASVQARESV